MMEIVIVIAASVSVFLIAAGLLLTIFSPRTAVLGRLGKVSATGSVVAGQAGEKRGLRENFLSLMGQLGRLLPRSRRGQEIQNNLVKADVMMRAEEYIGLILLTGIVFYTIIFLISNSMLFGVLGGAISLSFPGIIINSKKVNRSRAMTDQLPETLNIISSGLRAGFSFPQAVSVVVREIEGPLTKEFSRVLRENRLGKPMDDALNDLLERIENDDVELLVTALLIQRQVGGNLAEVLDGISHTIRERVRIKGEIRTLTAEGRLSALILSLLPVAMVLFLFVANPEYLLTLVQEPIGIAMIIVAVIMQIIGVFIIRKIVDIDV